MLQIESSSVYVKCNGFLFLDIDDHPRYFGFIAILLSKESFFDSMKEAAFFFLSLFLLIAHLFYLFEGSDRWS